MRNIFFLLICFYIIVRIATASFARYPENFRTPISVIAFGSCNRIDKPQPHWKTILLNNPDLWIWLGDNIYAYDAYVNGCALKHNAALISLDEGVLKAAIQAGVKIREV